MKKRNWKKIILTSASVLVGLVFVLAVHIYWVTKPHITDSTRILARIDLNQPIDREDASRISDWLYQQKGVEHVLVNPSSGIAIFSYAPVKGDANRIAQDLRRTTPYSKAARFMPPATDNISGCPVATTSLTYKVYSFMKRVL